MVRTYCLVPVFNEASGNLDSQPFARTTTSKPVVPVLCPSIVDGLVAQAKSDGQAALELVHEVLREAGDVLDLLD
ncbi:MAG: hypothetical protein QOG26_937 [Solirubrobacterales bacterium]|nr:hypothetical protein [Solirubrobacterales bacterium]